MSDFPVESMEVFLREVRTENSKMADRVEIRIVIEAHASGMEILQKGIEECAAMLFLKRLTRQTSDPRDMPKLYLTADYGGKE